MVGKNPTVEKNNWSFEEKMWIIEVILIAVVFIVAFGLLAFIEYQRNPPKFDEHGNQLFTLPIPGARVCIDYINGTNETGIVAVGEECLNYEW